MNKFHPLVILVAIHSLAGISAAQQDDPDGRPDPAYRERISEEELLRLRSGSKAMTGSSPDQATHETKPATFADASEFISFGGLCTFVPKGAILHVPEKMRGNMVAGLQGEVVFWTEFLNRFRAVVEPIEITIQEAAGAEAIEPNRLASAMRSERIIVTVIGGNPTSINRAPAKSSE